MNPTQLQSYIGGRFVGARAGAALASAIDGRTVAFAHADELDFGEAVDHARRVGVPALLALDFQQRAARLKALAKFLMEHKEQLYAISHHTGATRWRTRRTWPARTASSTCRPPITSGSTSAPA